MENTTLVDVRVLEKLRSDSRLLNELLSVKCRWYKTDERVFNDMLDLAKENILADDIDNGLYNDWRNE